MKVLQDEDERPIAAQAVDESEGELEQPSLVGRAPAEAEAGGSGPCQRPRRRPPPRIHRAASRKRAKPGATATSSGPTSPRSGRERLGLQLAAERPQRLEERPVRNALATEIDAAADQHASARLPCRSTRTRRRAASCRGPRRHRSRTIAGRARLGPAQGGVECA